MTERDKGMTQSYKGYEIELMSNRLASGQWYPWASVAIRKGKIIFTAIQSKGTWGFKTKRKANACALALAKVWIDHRGR